MAQVEEKMKTYFGNKWFACLSRREQQIVAYNDIVNPVDDDSPEMSMDVFPVRILIHVPCYGSKTRCV